MTRLLVFVITGSAVFLPVRPAGATLHEKVVGLQGALVLPSVAPVASSALLSTGWRTGAYFSYGVAETVELTVGLDVGRIAGRTDDGRFGNAPLRFSATLYRPYLGARWVFWSGGAVEPYLSGTLGFEWLATSETQWVTEDGVTRAKDEDLGQGRASLSAGIGVRWRLMDVFFVSIEGRYQVALNRGIAQHALIVPVLLGWKFDL